MKRSAKIDESSIAEKVVKKVIMSKEAIDYYSNLTEQQARLIGEVKKQLPKTEEMKGIIAEALKEINNSTEELVSMIPKVTDAASQLTTVMTETDNISEKTMEKIFKRGTTLAEETATILGEHREFVKSLNISLEKENEVNLRSITEKEKTIELRAKTINKEFAIIEKERKLFLEKHSLFKKPWWEATKMVICITLIALVFIVLKSKGLLN